MCLFVCLCVCKCYYLFVFVFICICDSMCLFLVLVLLQISVCMCVSEPLLVLLPYMCLPCLFKCALNDYMCEQLHDKILFNVSWWYKKMCVCLYECVITTVWLIKCVCIGMCFVPVCACLC